jgi:RNA polymerase sigma-54 factor
MAGPKFGMNQGMFQTQNLRMTPQLQQAIKLLQLSRMEFETAIRKEMEENPILEELGEGGDDEMGTAMEAEGAGSAQPEGAETVSPGEASELSGDLSQASGSESLSSTEPSSQDPTKQDEFDWENYLENSQSKSNREMSGGGTDELMNYENILSSSESLYEHIVWQINLSNFNDEEKRAAMIIAGYIEDDGYIKVPFEQIAEEEKIEVSELEEILPFIHEFDPAGVGARNLQECLLVQAVHLEEDTNDLVHLIKHHLKDLEKKNYENIAKSMGKDLEDIIALSKIIYEMDPKPGRSFSSGDTQYVTPDVYVYKVGDEYLVSLNDDGLPRLRISNFYKNALKEVKDETNKGAQDYIKDKLKSAVFLLKSIQQRQRTIYRVTEAIVRHQKDFFDKGPAFLKPMILRDIANDVSLHESTVSRVTSNKYVHTPRGIFELKYFFNSGINKTGGDTMASESVKLRIKEMVANEDHKDPISDQKIVELLKNEGIEIARRTVAKYRDVLGVLPSSKRKKYF